MISDIKDYSSRSRESGVSDNVIKTALMNMGHSRAEIEQIYTQLLGIKATESENYFTPSTDIQFGNQPSAPTTQEIAQDIQAKKEGKLKTKKTLAIVGIIILLLAISGAGLAYYNYTQNLPQNVLQKFNQAWLQIKTFRSKISIVASLTPERGATKQIEVNSSISASFDFSASTSAKFDGKILVNSGDFKNLSPLALDLVFLDEKLYFRSWDFGKFPLADLSRLNGIWVRATDSGIKQYESGTSTPFKIDTSLTIEKFKGMGVRFKQEMENPPVVFVGELPGEIIGGSDTYHYSFRIEKNKFDEFLGGVLDLTTEEIIESKEKRSEFYANLATSTLDIWINKNNFLPAKMVVNIEYQGIDKFMDKIVVENLFADINAQLTISEPNNTKDLEEIYGDLMAEYLKGVAGQTSSSTDSLGTTSTTSTSPKKTP